jgi:hypothetical protein
MTDWAQRASAKDVCEAFAAIYPRLALAFGADEDFGRLAQAVAHLRSDLHERTG